jgi:hypothetical protein
VRARLGFERGKHLGFVEERLQFAAAFDFWGLRWCRVGAMAAAAIRFRASVGVGVAGVAVGRVVTAVACGRRAGRGGNWWV